MTEVKESTFQKNAADLFSKLEATMKALKDKEYSAAVIDKGIAEAKSLLQWEKWTKQSRNTLKQNFSLNGQKLAFVRNLLPGSFSR